MANEAWTPAVLNKVKMLLAKGLSTAEIGKKIGMSKNAVVGKLNRLGWNAKSQEAHPKKAASGPSAKSGAGRAPAKRAPTPVKKVAPKAPAKSSPVKKVAPKIPAKKPVAGAPAKSQMPKGRMAPAPVPAPKQKALPKSNSKTLAMHQRIIQHSLELSSLKPDQCRWPIGDPDSEKFHFCGATVFVGKPYCYEHCKMAYQFQPPKKKN